MNIRDLYLVDILRKHIHKQREKRMCMEAFKHDAEVFYANSTTEENTPTRRIARVMKRCHVLEKGLTMPDMRLGFGKENLLALIDDLLACLECDGTIPAQTAYCVAVIAEYAEVHQRAGFELDADLARGIHSLLAKCPAKPVQQPEISREEYFSKTRAAFDEFSASRHSVRSFLGSVAIEQIKSAIKLANNSPSACNRQPCRVHLICSQPLIRKCLALQNGNRGFGHSVDKLLILTADLHTIWLNERNDLFTNGGIYLMNLCYALHHYKVAHCILNWSPTCGDYKSINSDEGKLYELLNLLPSERVIAFVACGGLPERFRLALSTRKEVAEVLVVHEE